MVGVFFDNTGGQGKLCYVKADFVITRCVGSVKAVTILKVPGECAKLLATDEAWWK